MTIFHGRRDKEDHTAVQPQDHLLRYEKSSAPPHSRNTNSLALQLFQNSTPLSTYSPKLWLSPCTILTGYCSVCQKALWEIVNYHLK